VNEYRCTRNAPYAHDCIGHDDITARQGYYIEAETTEEALQKMTIRFPEETEAGFTVQKWERFDVVVMRVERDENGNIIREEPCSP
jgi:thermostable 8-oxoguanine DNA glycosylase